MTRRTSLALLGLMSTLAIAAAACNSTEAKPAVPVAYPAAFNAGPYYHGFETQSQPSISISGQGRATAPPDVAVIQLSITVRGPTATRARDDGKEAINDLLDTLRENGVEGEDVETRSFSISPITKRDEETGESRIVEYQLRNVSDVTLRNVDRVGKLLDELVGTVGDVLRISNITLAIEDPTEIQRQAREKAMQDAQAKAQQLADLAGIKVGPPLSISESLEGAPSGLLAKEVLVTPVEEGVGPVSIGELEAAVSVFVVYSLIGQ